MLYRIYIVLCACCCLGEWLLLLLLLLEFCENWKLFFSLVANSSTFCWSFLCAHRKAHRILYREKLFYFPHSSQSTFLVKNTPQKTSASRYSTGCCSYIHFFLLFSHYYCCYFATNYFLVFFIPSKNMKLWDENFFITEFFCCCCFYSAATKKFMTMEN